MIGQRSFIVQPPQALQHRASTAEAACMVGTSPIASSSLRNRPTPRRRHVCAPAPTTKACTSIGTSTAAGDIGTIDPAMAAPRSLSVHGGCGIKFRQLENGEPVKSHPDQSRSRRGYAGNLRTDCISHDDYRSADFNGPMVAP